MSELRKMTPTILGEYRKAGHGHEIFAHLKYVPTICVSDGETTLFYDEKQYPLAGVEDHEKAAEQINKELEAGEKSIEKAKGKGKKAPDQDVEPGKKQDETGELPAVEISEA
jgi:hypothetical protein